MLSQTVEAGTNTNKTNEDDNLTEKPFYLLFRLASIGGVELVACLLSYLSPEDQNNWVYGLLNYFFNDNFDTEAKVQKFDVFSDSLRAAARSVAFRRAVVWVATWTAYVDCCCSISFRITHPQ